MDESRWDELASSIAGKSGLRLRAEQKKLISGVMNGENTLGVLPTGFGKSICYQVPAAINEGIVLVVVPTIALMHDQVERLRRNGVHWARLVHSQLSQQAIRTEIAQAVKSKKAILYVCPERFQDAYFLNQIRTSRVSLIVVDEAHVCLQWSGFRPGYEELGRNLKAHFDGIPIMALTATLDKKSQRDLESTLQSRFSVKISECPISSRIQLEYRHFDRRLERFEFVYNRVRQAIDSGERGILFARTRAAVRGLSATLSKMLRKKVGGYHGELSKNDRDQVHNDFAFGKMKWLVATSGFGMGVDVGDVAHVIHYELPLGLMDYIQQIGRGGRSLEAYRATICELSGDRDMAQRLLESGAANGDQFRVDATVANREYARLLKYLDGSSDSPSGCQRRLLASLASPRSELARSTCGCCCGCKGAGVIAEIARGVAWESYALKTLVSAAAENEGSKYAVGRNKFIALLTVTPYFQDIWPKRFLQKQFSHTGALVWLDKSEADNLYSKALAKGLIEERRRNGHPYVAARG